jgi:hypothetical protein
MESSNLQQVAKIERFFFAYPTLTQQLSPFPSWLGRNGKMAKMAKMKSSPKKLNLS